MVLNVYNMGKCFCYTNPYILPFPTCLFSSERLLIRIPQLLSGSELKSSALLVMFDVQFCFQTHANEILYSNFAPIRGIHRLLKRSKEF